MFFLFFSCLIVFFLSFLGVFRSPLPYIISVSISFSWCLLTKSSAEFFFLLFFHHLISHIALAIYLVCYSHSISMGPFLYYIYGRLESFLNVIYLDWGLYLYISVMVLIVFWWLFFAVDCPADPNFLYVLKNHGPSVALNL